MGHSKSKIAGIELDDETIDRLTKNTNYTAEQIRQWHDAFLRDCPNGKLSSRQFTEVYKKFYPEYEAEKYSRQVFRTFDMDNNGYIDFVEFLLAVNVNSNGDVRDKLGLAFDIYDLNSNGQVRTKKTKGKKVILGKQGGGKRFSFFLSVQTQHAHDVYYCIKDYDCLRD